MPRKNPDIKLTAEQRAIIDALCEHDLYASGTSGADVIIGCRKCPAAAARSATSRRSPIEWDDEATPSVTLVRVLNAGDQEGGYDGPEDLQDPAESLVITSERIQMRYGIGRKSARAGVIYFDDLHAAQKLDMSSAEFVETAKALDALAEWIDGLDRARSYHDLINYRDRVFDIGDFGPALEEVDKDLWDALADLVGQCRCENYEGVCRLITADEVKDLPKSHDAYKAAFWLALQSCIDGEWNCETDGYFRFFDYKSEYLVNAADLDDKIAALKFAEEWAIIGFFIYDHSGISLSRGRVCAWDSSFAGYVCEKVREGETLAEAEQRASDLLSAMDAHYRGCYTQHTVQTAKVYRPSDLDDLDWEDGDSCGGCLYTEWSKMDAPAEDALAAEVSALEKDGVTVINLGVVHVD